MRFEINAVAYHIYSSPWPQVQPVTSQGMQYPEIPDHLHRAYAGEVDGSIARISYVDGELWSRARIPNAEEAILLDVEVRAIGYRALRGLVKAPRGYREPLDPIEDLSDGRLGDSKLTDEARRKADGYIWFPLWTKGFYRPLFTNHESLELPDVTADLQEPIRLNTFSFEKVHGYSAKTKSKIKRTLKQQIKFQVPADIGGEPEITFPSSPSRYIDITFRGVKKYAPGHELSLQWDGLPLKHEKVGVFLPDDQIIIGIRGVRPDHTIVKVLRGLHTQVQNLITIIDFQTSYRAWEDGEPKKPTLLKVAMLAVFRDPGLHPAILPRWVYTEHMDYKLFFEDDRKTCDFCRLENDGARANKHQYGPRVECAYCSDKDHCEYMCRKNPNRKRIPCSRARRPPTSTPVSTHPVYEDFSDLIPQ